MSAWVLPDHIADVLPLQARQVETCRRALLDTARTYGYELVIPPLVEHIDSLLSGSGQALDLQTFKLVDLLSGRTLGVRADTTQQVARIDTHLLNRQGESRLCYCGPVLHTRPQQPYGSREPLQFGAELYGASSECAEHEVVTLALDVLYAAGLPNATPLVLDMADARIVPALLEQAPNHTVNIQALQTALISKNAEALQQATADLPPVVQQQLQTLFGLYGGKDVLQQAAQQLPALPAITQALAQLQSLCDRVAASHPQVQLQIDLADARGYSYYSGIRFAIYLPKAADALVRGGRYDSVGAVFGRQRPAVGFSLDVKDLAEHIAQQPESPTIAAVWQDDAQWHQAVRQLRAQGHTVVVQFSQPAPQDAATYQHALVKQGGAWVVQALPNS